MTTRIEIKNKGPDQLGIWFYDCNGNRTSDPAIIVPVGESFEFDTHDGKRAMPFADAPGKLTTDAEDGVVKIYSVPPAYYYEKAVW